MNNKKTKKTNLDFRTLFVLLLFTFISGGFVFYTGFVLADNFIAPLSVSGDRLDVDEEVSVSSQTVVISEESQIINVVEKTSPAVVSIIATAEVPVFETYYEDIGGGFGNSFEFRIPQRRQSGTEILQVGAGTGFIVSSDGYIVTNKHVIADVDAEYTVFLNNQENVGERIVAKVLARDPDNDLAILKIDKNNLQFLEFGDSDLLKVGQTALTIGYALGEFDNTVSKGVISGLARSILAADYMGFDSERLYDLIQSDAAINPGNSGGPMLDINGKVIGVNVAMASAENISFAIPSNKAREAYEEVRKTGTIKKDELPFLGVRYMIIGESLMKSNNLPYNYGALIVKGETEEDLAVVPGSPADTAGIVENDIILEINKEKINIKNTVAEVIRNNKPGDKIELKIYHNAEEKTLELELGKR